MLSHLFLHLRIAAQRFRVWDAQFQLATAQQIHAEALATCGLIGFDWLTPHDAASLPECVVEAMDWAEYVEDAFDRLQAAQNRLVSLQNLNPRATPAQLRK